ncbi:MAG TPA: hypothetical protein DEA40_12840 [Parvularcula sp.]|nr:hypothetical protein [Parvularcula sp.]HBS36324.1 hypothetical protein [Parvularcula sp.]
MAFNARRYTRDFLAAMVLYVASVFGAAYGAHAIKAEGAALIAISLAPMIPAVIAAAVFFRHFATMDEMFRRLHAESFAASALFVGLATFALGFVEDEIPFRLSMIWVLPALIGGWGLIVCARNYLRLR